MACLQLDYQSRALNQQMKLIAFVPEPGPENEVAAFPVVYQLHGLSHCHSTWLRRTSLERYACDHGVIVVCPEGGRSFYSNTGYGDWEDHLLDVIRFIDHLLPTIPERWARAIGGLSMGGYGSLKMGLKHPHLFCSVAAHSGVMDLSCSVERERFKDLAFLFKDGLPAGDDIMQLAQQADVADLPAIYIDCGTDDFLIEHNRDCHRLFEALNIPHTYQEFPGAHTWDYWDLHVQDALRFHDEHLKRG